MQDISPLGFHRSSLSLRQNAYRRLLAGLQILRRNGVIWSESQLLCLLAKMYAQHWRGSGLKSATARRYNLRNVDAGYVIRSWYVNQVLYAALWERSVHTGQSVSRMVDFAIRHYLGSLLNRVLRGQSGESARSRRNAAFWARRYENRRRKHGDVLLNYSCTTRENWRGNLEYVQRMEIIPLTGLTPGDFLHPTDSAA